MASVQWFKRDGGLSRPITWNIRTAGSNRPMSWTAGPEAVVNLLPQDVISAGYTTLTFVDDFTSLASIDMAGTGEAGRKWYRRMPFDAAPNNDTPTSAISIIDVNGSPALRLTQAFENWNQGLYTVHRQTRQGRGFRYGYFEARMKFDPSNATTSNGFPAFWLLGMDHVLGDDDTRWGELDIFEAFHYQSTTWNGQFVGTVHDWWAGSPNIDRSNTGSHMSAPLGVNFTEWHTYSALWTPGRIRWYFDGNKVLEQAYGTGLPVPNVNGNPAGTYSILDTKTSGMAMILGTGTDYPLDVDWVKVWQAA